jgi:putative FmdB family regulatory protein
MGKERSSVEFNGRDRSPGKDRFKASIKALRYGRIVLGSSEVPIYEYRCRDCGRKSVFITLSVKSRLEPKCRKCGSTDLEKLVSRVAVSRSEESRMESLADSSKLSGLDENDPKSVARWMKKMGKEMGEEAGEDFDQSIDEAMEEAEAGEDSEAGKGGEEEDF